MLSQSPSSVYRRCCYHIIWKAIPDALNYVGKIDAPHISQVSGRCLRWLSTRYGECVWHDVTPCRIHNGTCRIQLRLYAFSCVPDKEASIHVAFLGTGDPSEVPTILLLSSAPYDQPQSQSRNFSGSSRLASTHNDHTPEMTRPISWTVGLIIILLVLGSQRGLCMILTTRFPFEVARAKCCLKDSALLIVTPRILSVRVSFSFEDNSRAGLIYL